MAPCPHVHTTGIACPDRAGHDDILGLPHALPDGCTKCNVEAPEPTDEARAEFLRDLFDAFAAPLPEPRIMTALVQALAASWDWGNIAGWGQAAVAAIRGDRDEAMPTGTWTVPITGTGSLTGTPAVTTSTALTGSATGHTEDDTEDDTR